VGTPVDHHGAASAAGVPRLTRPPIEPLETPFRLQLHSQGDLDRLKDATYEILATVGVKFPSQTALDILAEHDCEVDAATQIVRFPRELVEQAMDQAPRHFTLGARDPSCELSLDGRHTYCTTDGCGVEVVDFETRERRTSTKADVAAITRMVDYLPGLCFWWPTVSAADHGETAQLHELEAGFSNTVKHLQGMVMGARKARYAVEMATVIAGSAAELRRRPPLSDLIGTISPLLQDTDGIEAALVFAKAGVPVCFVSMAMMGTTAPATHAGAYAATFAELVSATVLLQLAHPGAPVLHANYLSHADPRSGAILSAPLDVRARYLPTELAHAWGVPSMSGFGGTDAPAIGWQSAMEETEALMQSGWDGAETMSGYGLINKYTLWVPEHMILDHDIYQRARYSIMDIEIDGESLALETVKAVGPGGHFLGQAHTRRHMRETTKPAITHVPGPDGGFLDPVEAARKRAELILRTYQPEPLEPAKAAELARIVAAADAELR
jgi:trimethylamine--corrinoid protein Co-methyltransferase